MQPTAGDDLARLDCQTRRCRPTTRVLRAEHDLISIRADVRLVERQSGKRRDVLPSVQGWQGSLRGEISSPRGRQVTVEDAAEAPDAG